MGIPIRYYLAVMTFLLSVLLYIDRTCISIAKEPIAAEYGFSEVQMGWVFAAFSLGYALFQTPSGMLADKFGPRYILSSVVALWSLFTGLTAFAWNLTSMLAIRFLFGAGEAGAFPNMARAVFSWFPMSERGRVQGLNFSGSRLGAAFTLPLLAWMISDLGWKVSFWILAGIGFVWALMFFAWFRNDPTEHSWISDEEKEHILANRQEPSQESSNEQLSFFTMIGSTNMWYTMTQYFCSNFTFFFALTWLYPHIKETYNLNTVEASFYASIPLICGAVGNWTSGWLVDKLYSAGKWELSRKAPAMIGFLLAAVGLIASMYMTTATGAILFLSIAIFGADMTLSPSWSLCIDIGKNHSGAVSGTMNMAGNIGAFITSIAFAYLKDWTGAVSAFFVLGAVLNVLAIFLWWMIKPSKQLEAS